MNTGESKILSFDDAVNDQIPLTSMDQLMEEFFGVNGAFRPHYSYAQATKLPTAQRPTTPLDHSHVPMLTHDSVLHFLAPHEILALWQTSKAAWESTIPKQRYFIMMRSVFSYLKISKEAAQHVDSLIIGGWHFFCPLMVSLCLHLARVYGNFETDESHRVFMAHQACFYPKSRGFWHCGSKLAEHEVRLGRILDMIHYSQPTAKLPPPTLDVLKIDSHIGWGDAETYLEHQAANKSDSLMEPQSWMADHANEAPNAHYRLRLQQGLSPCLWMDQCVQRQLSRDYKPELRLWALGIGTRRQQFLGTVSTTQSEAHVCLFYHCLEYDPSNPSCFAGGFMELVLRRSHASGHSPEYNDAFQPTLGILIWFMRRGLEPFTDTRIDWKALIDHVCRSDSAMFRRFYREGSVPWDPFGPHAPRPDPVDNDFVEREREFYTEALVSPLFGPADFEEYV